MGQASAGAPGGDPPRRSPKKGGPTGHYTEKRTKLYDMTAAQCRAALIRKAEQLRDGGRRPMDNSVSVSASLRSSILIFWKSRNIPVETGDIQNDQQRLRNGEEPVYFDELTIAARDMLLNRPIVRAPEYSGDYNWKGRDAEALVGQVTGEIDDVPCQECQHAAAPNSKSAPVFFECVSARRDLSVPRDDPNCLWVGNGKCMTCHVRHRPCSHQDSRTDSQSPQLGEGEFPSSQESVRSRRARREVTPPLFDDHMIVPHQGQFQQMGMYPSQRPSGPVPAGSMGFGYGQYAPQPAPYAPQPGMYRMQPPPMTFGYTGYAAQPPPGPQVDGRSQTLRLPNTAGMTPQQRQQLLAQLNWATGAIIGGQDLPGAPSTASGASHSITPQTQRQPLSELQLQQRESSSSTSRSQSSFSGFPDTGNTPSRPPPTPRTRGQSVSQPSGVRAGTESTSSSSVSSESAVPAVSAPPPSAPARIRRRDQSRRRG